jgi:hypothetical protein
MNKDMLIEIKTALSHQLKASLHTLGHVIETCPDSEWQKEHGDAPFSQVVFHALFNDYEEMEDREPVHRYEKGFCRDYLAHCLSKVDAIMATETLESLAGESGVDFRHCNRMELYIYGERHIQHHAAQLGLRIQQVSGIEMKWVSGH